jgi:DNA repair protein RadC
MKTTTTAQPLEFAFSEAFTRATPKRQFYTRNLRLVADVVSEIDSAFCSAPEQSVAYMAGAFDQFIEQEQFWIILLDARNRVIGRQLITVGTMCQTLVSAREVFRSAIIGGACSIILVHNHPSGDPAPSSADARVTVMLRQAGGLLSINVSDHVIIGSTAGDPAGRGYYSFRAAGRL